MHRNAPTIAETAEAALELTRARIATLFWRASIFSPLPGGSPNRADAEALAQDLAASVARTARAMPFRALCLQQSLALRRMLHRRGVASVLRLGVAPDQVGDAHAWLTVNGRIVSGAEGAERFRVLAEFS